MSLIDDFLDGCTEVESLAEGGQKKVIAAKHPEWGRVVAKFGEYRYSNSLERIAREVGLLREIDSNYYPEQFKFLVDPATREFLIIEERLAAVELSVASGRFNSDVKILRLLKQLVEALEVLWDRKVVHRDLKPANILITEQDEPRIVDLGIARFLDETSLTASAMGAGPHTPTYSSPEQLRNQKSQINHRTDFFLLGIIVSELMLKFHPFDPQHIGNQCSLPENILTGVRVTLPPGHDQRLVEFVNRSLKSQPYRRFRTPAEVKLALEM